MTDERLKGHRIGLNGSPRQGLSRQRSGAQDLPLPRAALGAFPVSRGAFPSSLRAFRQLPSRSARSSPRGHRVFGNGRAPRISSGWSAHDDRPASPDIGVRDRSIRLSVEPTPSGPALGRTHPGTSPCRWMPVVRRLLLSNAIDDLRLLPGEREPRDLASLPLLKGAVPGARDPTAERHVSRPRPITSEESGSLLCLCDRYERGPRRAGADGYSWRASRRGTDGGFGRQREISQLRLIRRLAPVFGAMRSEIASREQTGQPVPKNRRSRTGMTQWRKSSRPSRRLGGRPGAD
jgi:hypothetical protein